MRYENVTFLSCHSMFDMSKNVFVLMVSSVCNIYNGKELLLWLLRQTSQKRCSSGKKTHCWTGTHSCEEWSFCPIQRWNKNNKIQSKNQKTKTILHFNLPPPPHFECQTHKLFWRKNPRKLRVSVTFAVNVNLVETVGLVITVPMNWQLYSTKVCWCRTD